MQTIPVPNTQYIPLPDGATPGAVGRKWGVNGATKFRKQMDSLAIEVQHEVRVERVTADMASMHERGHAHTINDVLLDAPNADEAWTTMCGYDRWQCEVEAWIRGLNEQRTLIDNIEEAEFVLDCLNSYRRGLPDVTDADWEEAVEVIIGSIVVEDEELRQRIREYEPIEPEPNDPAPGGCMPSVPMPGDDGEDNDGGDGDEDMQGNGEGETPNPDNLTENFDAGWLAPNILDALQGGVSATTLARERGLDVNRMPPLAQALNQGGE